MRWVFAILVVLAAGGCNPYGYRFAPAVEQVNPTDPVLADYRLDGAWVDVTVATGGRRLDAMEIETASGKIIQPASVAYPEFKPEVIGGMMYDNSLDRRYGADRPQGPTVGRFDRAAIGKQPWKLWVEIRGLARMSIVIDR